MAVTRNCSILISKLRHKHANQIVQSWISNNSFKRNNAYEVKYEKDMEEIQTDRQPFQIVSY